MQPDRLQKKRKGKAITWAEAAKLVCGGLDFVISFGRVSNIYHTSV